MHHILQNTNWHLLKKYLYSTILLIALGTIAHSAQKKVLFIGNSYTDVNNLPELISNIATSAGDTLNYSTQTAGGATARTHWNNPAVQTAIAQGSWDYVIIQCQSQEPSFSPSQVASDTYPYVKKLDSLVKSTNRCAEVMYYMTWGYVNGDQNNCQFYTPICTYAGQQQRLRESYLMFAQDFKSSVAPVGVAWAKVRNQYPNYNMYQTDGSHPSIYGTYLAACVFYSSLFLKSSIGNQYLPAGVGNGDAFNLQTIANTTVFDSLENWQRYGNNPFAKYTYTLNGNTVSFTNLSKRFQNLTWDFGDGQTSAQASPTHTYTQAGTMKACLTITNNCGTTTSVCDTFSLNTSGINDLAVGNHQVFTYYNNTVTLQPSVTATAFELYNLNGQLLKQFELSPNYFQMKLQDFPAGIYLLTGRNTAGSYKEKIQIQ